MEPSSYIENEEPSVFPQSEFYQAPDAERERLEEVALQQAEQIQIEEGVSALCKYQRYCIG